MTEEKIERGKVRDYLRGLGFDESVIGSEILTSGGHEADFVLYREDKKTLAVVEVKTVNKDYPRSRDSKLRFHPYVRQAQLLADQLKAPYYLLSDGKSFFWFTTDSSGWPLLLEDPISPATGLDATQEGTSKEGLVRVLQDLQQFVFWRGGAARPEEIAIVILAKLLDEAGDGALYHTILESRWSQTSLPFFSEGGLSALISDLTKPRKTGRNLADALKLIDHVTFTDLNPRIVLSALDETILPSQADRGPWRIDRWLADFMVRLARPSDAGFVLDLSASYGDILAAAKMSYAGIKLAGVIRQPLPAVWAKIQQLVLRNRNETIFSGPTVPREVMVSNLIGEPSCIITAPSFGARVEDENDGSRLYRVGVHQVEDLILELALEWVAPSGRVVMLVPESLLFSAGKRQLTRQMLLNHSCLRGVISLAPGLLSSSSVLKSSLLIFDRIRPDNSPTFIASLDSFKDLDSFDSREIATVKEVLDKFRQYEDDAVTLSDDNTRVIQSNGLDVNDLTAAHYLFGLEGKPASKYPLFSLEQVSKKLSRGKPLRLRDYGETPVIGPAMIRSLELDKSAIGMTSRLELPVNAPTVDSGDVLLNLIGNHLGEAALVSPELAGSYISGHVALLRPNTNLVDPEYLAIALNGPHAKQQIGQLFTGALIRGLPLNRLKTLTIPVPDLDTQKEIVAAVSRARAKLDDAKRLVHALEARYQELVETVISQGVAE